MRDQRVVETKHDKQISSQGDFWVIFRVVQTADTDISTQPVVATKLTINTSTHSIYPIPTCFVFSQKSSNNWSLTCSSYLSKMLCFQNRSTTIHHFGNGISNTNRCIISKTIYFFQDLRKNDVLDVLSCDLSVVFWPKDWDLRCLAQPRVHCPTSHGRCDIAKTTKCKYVGIPGYQQLKNVSCPTILSIVQLHMANLGQMRHSEDYKI